MVKPNFFIVGAPKCGTTSMYHYLRQHPDIFMPDFKEPHYFGNDLTKDKDYFILDEKNYINLFLPGKNKKLIGEASSHYLYSKTAPKEINLFNPESKIIILLRNPVELVYSLHSQYVFSGNENILNFKEAISLEHDRRNGEKLPPNLDLREKVYYKSYINRLPSQITAYLKIFGENVKIITLDDLVNKIDITYESVIKFLNLDASFKPQFKIHNPNKIPKSLFIRNMIKNYGIILGKLRKIISDKPLGIVKTIEKLNTDFTIRKPMNPLLKKQLQKEFLPIIEELEIILHRNLSEWK